MTVPYQGVPHGWFAVATSSELRRGCVLERRYFGREWVLWRSVSGRVAMQDAYCPHLGAHLGDGRVCGEHLQCPFHHFEYATDGRCAATPSGGAPPSIRLVGLPIRETNGIILAHWHERGEAPAWEPPDLDEEEFTGFHFSSRTFRGHPQEVSENSADCGHFGPTHGYGNACITDGPRIEGHVLYSSYTMDRSLDFIGLPRAKAELSFDAQVHGLGLSRVRARVSRVGIEADLLILPTPIDASTVQLRFGARVRRSRVPLLTMLMKAAFVRGYHSDLLRDIPIWTRKRFVERPPLTAAEAPIAMYRRYARQFYCDASAGQRRAAVGE
ncbi:MAG TPA: Rieske 2Fe-2S domain-containing protein [Candidatus Limnocylindrales bacterium]|nr:Rieske 2Fe-2S domain-containing protein [Candidatus Limnocylindrales bacterium]